MHDPAYTDGAVLLYQGNCLEVLAMIEANSADACVTDPPYGLEFMGKDWDSFKPSSAKIRLANNRDRERGNAQDGFTIPRRNKPEAYIAGTSFQEWCFTWATAVFRVLKPGAYLVAMGGTRTHHRLMCALEDAGFEIRDTLMYLYGSGFPKSMDISKAIDKEAGVDREVVGVEPRSATRPFLEDQSQGKAYCLNGDTKLTAPATDVAKEWQGYGSALKPAYEPVILCRKPLDAGLTLAQNVQRFGTGALAIDACRVGTESIKGHGYPGEDLMGAIKGNGVEGKPDYHISHGRWPANVLTSGEAEVVAMFPKTSSGAWNGVINYARHAQHSKGNESIRIREDRDGDTGSAARFFAVCPPDPPQRFLYTSKVSPEERARSTHPTQKPLSLMTWLLELVTRPGALVLDPFLGSGTTAVACHRLKRRCLGIERESEYLAIAQYRMEQEWYQEQQTLF